MHGGWFVFRKGVAVNLNSRFTLLDSLYLENNWIVFEGWCQWNRIFNGGTTLVCTESYMFLIKISIVSVLNPQNRAPTTLLALSWYLPSIPSRANWLTDNQHMTLFHTGMRPCYDDRTNVRVLPSHGIDLWTGSEFPLAHCFDHHGKLVRQKYQTQSSGLRLLDHLHTGEMKINDCIVTTV